MKLQITLSVMVYFVLLIILVLNIDDKSKVIKNSFLILLISLFVALFFANEIVMDYLISIIIRYFYYPTFASIMATIIFTMIIFINSIYDDKMKDFLRIINYIFASYIFISFIIFMLLKVDVNSYNSLYDGNSLICLRYISRTFVIWLIINILFKYFYYFDKNNK